MSGNLAVQNFIGQFRDSDENFDFVRFQNDNKRKPQSLQKGV